jgi:preprotein translocase subunit SecE
LWVRFLPGLPDRGNAVLTGGVLPVSGRFIPVSLSRRISPVWGVAAPKEIYVAKEEKSIVRRQPNAIQRYFRETVGELKKVNWPTRKEAVNLTIVVLIVTFTMSVILGVLDFLFSQLFALILS